MTAAQASFRSSASRPSSSRSGKQYPSSRKRPRSLATSSRTDRRPSDRLRDEHRELAEVALPSCRRVISATPRRSDPAAVLVASRLAARITVPLARIHDALRGLDWDALARDGGPAGPATGVGELEELEAAFSGMRATLRRTMDEALEARAHETKATLLALQSQMDPHFVYNMLTTIGIMAEEGVAGEIAESIQNMTHLLRYNSSGKATVVTLGDEIEYARRYLACMKARFRESLSFDINVPDSALDVRVPKLIIQPIIENTIKYGLTTRPPWQIGTRGSDSGAGHVHRWTISVTDNGPGFPEEKLRDLNGKMSSRAGSADPSLSISGMGLANIAIRLAIFYGIEAVCSAANRPEGGAIVTIGGTHEPKTNLVGPDR